MVKGYRGNLAVVEHLRVYCQGTMGSQWGARNAASLRKVKYTLVGLLREYLWKMQ